jgi:hypothetical protein
MMSDKQNPDQVICPDCCHQFTAIPVNVQAKLKEAEAHIDSLQLLNLNKQGNVDVLLEEIKRLREALEPLAYLDMTGVTAEIVFQRNKTKILESDVKRANKLLEDK